MNARETALDVLIACRKRAAWSNGVLKDYIDRDQLDRRDAALATRLCYGILQHRGMRTFQKGCTAFLRNNSIYSRFFYQTAALLSDYSQRHNNSY